MALEKGIHTINPNIKCIHHPLADGGDGSLDILSNFFEWEEQRIPTVDPLERKVEASYFYIRDTAFIELASATGLVLLNVDERNPLHTTTLGTGIMIRHAIERGAQKIYLFLGGSSTTDAGMGIAHALGIRLLDQHEQVLSPLGKNLEFVRTIDSSQKMAMDGVVFEILCDVSNPLYGQHGAAHVYAPQKGANEEEVLQLDRGLQNIAHVLKTQTNLDIQSIAGGGAAGGIAAGMSALFDVNIRRGFETIAAITRLEQRIRDADWVISGEGMIDRSSLRGKVVQGVAQLCQQYHKPLTLFAGKCQLESKDIQSMSAHRVHSIMDIAQNEKDAMKNAATHLQHLARVFAEQIS